MRPSFTILLSFLVVAFGYILFFSEGDVSPPIDKSVDGSQFSNNLASDAVASDAISRVSIDQTVEGTQHWSSVPFLALNFPGVFAEYFVTKGGEEEAIQHVLAKTEEIKNLGYFDKVPEMMTRLADNGMVVGAGGTSLFQDVVYSEHFHIAGLLHDQIASWRDMKSKQLKGDYHFPKERMSKFPLCYSPEMHLSNLSAKVQDHSFSSELLENAAAIRNMQVRESGRIELERYVMLRSIYRTIEHFNVEVSAREWDEVVAQLLPNYQNILAGADDVRERYLDSLRVLLLENGYELKD